MFSIFKNRRKRFKELVYPHVNFLYNMALGYAGGRFDAEDLVQEALFIAYREFHQLRDPEQCKGWLFAILRRAHLKEVRSACRKRAFEWEERQGYIEHLEAAAASVDAERLLAAESLKAEVRERVAGLPEKYKSPVMLHYMEGLSVREVSAFLDVPEGTVLSRLSRARAYLKREMLRAEVMRTSRENVVKFAGKRKANQ